jgi:hypothetical protein
MPSLSQRFSVLLSIIVLGASFSRAADLQSAKRAYEQKDFATALKEATPLAEQGNPEAQALLGRMYMRGQGVLMDLDQAIKWLRPSAATGNADAQFLLGSIYLLPQKDVPEGVKWMRLSAEQGNQDAQYLLGKAFLQGLQGLPRDPIQAEMWLTLAAKGNLEFYQGELTNAERQIGMLQIARGRALAAEFKPKPGLKPQEQPPAGEKPQQDAKPKS